MKNKILLFSFLLFSLSASAQYFEVGMEWVYGQYTTMPGWPPSIGTITIIGDTTINNEPVFIIEGGGEHETYDIRYISESGQKVYYYKDDEKRLLFDFSLGISDTLNVITPFCCSGNLEDTLVAWVDSISVINFNGAEWKYQHFNGGWEWSNHIVEGVGSLYSFFPNPPLADNAYSKLRCVVYPNGDILKFTDDEDCYTILGVNDLEQSGLAIYPNPVIDELTIENRDEKTYGLRVFNQQGQALYFSEKSHDGQKLNTSSWASGVYLVQVVVREGIFTQVFVKE
ncbi:MAG TPA: T9SS type A sorting domain-containing protein [Saprospiraceae bacterium]|nr:T9SS type A sorting domain-containing protein [Saprospiraceae bacterium]